MVAPHATPRTPPLGRRRGAAIVAFALLATGVAAFVDAQAMTPEEAQDPRNQAFQDYGSCYGHHYPRISPRWVNPTISFVPPDGPVVVGQPFTVGVRVTNPYNFLLKGSPVDLSIENATALSFVGVGQVEEQEFAGSVGRADQEHPIEPRATLNFTLRPTPGRVVVSLEAFEGALAGTPGAPNLDLDVVSPNGEVFGAASPGSAETVEVPFPSVLEGVPGTWGVVVIYRSGAAPSAEFTVRVQADYDVAPLRAMRIVSPALPTIGMNATVEWTLVAASAGDVALDVRGKLFQFHPHKPEDEGHTLDEGRLSRFLSPTLLVLAEPPLPPPPPDEGFLGLPGFGAVALFAALGATAYVLCGRRMCPSA